MLFRRRPPLLPHEGAILDAAVAAAPAPVAEMLRAQIAQIRFVQRIAGSAEINFYARRRRGGGWSEESLFPNRGEVHFADFSTLIAGQRHAGSLISVAGHVFALTLRPQLRAPKRAVAGAVEVRLIDPDRLLRADETNPALEQVPASYLADRESAQSQEAGSWTIFDPADTFVVSLPDADWVALAESRGGHLLLGRASDGAESFSVANVETTEVTALSATSLRSALREAASSAS